MCCCCTSSAVAPGEVHFPKPVINVNLAPPKSIRDRQVILGRRKMWEMQPKYQSFRQLRISLQRTSCLLNVSLGPHCPPRHSRAPEQHINHYSLSMIVSFTLIPLKLLLELKARVTGKKSSGLPPTLNSRLPLLLFESINGCWRKTLVRIMVKKEHKLK